MLKYASYLRGNIIEISHEDEYKYILVGNDPKDIYTMVKLFYDEKTLVMDCEYNEIDIKKLNVGDYVFCYHKNQMTLSIPPQTTAYIIELK